MRIDGVNVSMRPLPAHPTPTSPDDLSFAESLYITSFIRARENAILGASCRPDCIFMRPCASQFARLHFNLAGCISNSQSVLCQPSLPAACPSPPTGCVANHCQSSQSLPSYLASNTQHFHACKLSINHYYVIFRLDDVIWVHIFQQRSPICWAHLHQLPLHFLLGKHPALSFILNTCCSSFPR